jgi:small ligand-binding sensory domain FIST
VEDVMRWTASHSSLPDASAAAEAATAVQAELGPGPVDLVVAFFSATLVAAAPAISQALKRRLEPGCLIATSARGVISSTRELESGPALTVIAARLPGVRVHPFILTNELWAAAAEDPLEFARAAPHVARAELVVLLGDPFSLEVDVVLAAFNRHAPGTRVVGGMASAGVRPGANALVLNDWVAPQGGVAVALEGNLRADVILSQGCKPVGPPLRVTRAHGNVLFELDGQPALERAEQVLQALGEQERAHLKNGLYVGRPVREGSEGRGDYLIRNLLGADRDRGLIAIGDQANENERIRLHVRDAETAREDLELLLTPQAFDRRAAAALIFACNGRGRGLYGVPDADIGMLQSALGSSEPGSFPAGAPPSPRPGSTGGPVPVAGMFCTGEIGPVANRNFLHGHTASIAIVREKAPA